MPLQISWLPGKLQSAVVSRLNPSDDFDFGVHDGVERSPAALEELADVLWMHHYSAAVERDIVDRPTCGGHATRLGRTPPRPSDLRQAAKTSSTESSVMQR